MDLVTGSDQKHLGSRTLSKTPLSTFAKHHKKGAPENPVGTMGTWLSETCRAGVGLDVVLSNRR